MSIDNPHISFPFRLNASGTQAVVVEQDTDSEIEDCVEVLLSTEKGSREEVPGYGTEDQSFKQGGVDLDQIDLAITQWEPRAEKQLAAGTISALIQSAQVSLIERGNA